MYGREQRVLLRHYLERGLSKTEVARELGVSRRTVYHWLATGQLDRELDKAVVQYASRPAVACKIDAFRPIIDTRLAEFPKLTRASAVAQRKLIEVTKLRRDDLEQVRLSGKAEADRHAEAEANLRSQIHKLHQAQQERLHNIQESRTRLEEEESVCKKLQAEASQLALREPELSEHAW